MTGRKVCVSTIDAVLLQGLHVLVLLGYIGGTSTSSKGRGRPETTGEYRIKKAKTAEKEALKRKRKIEEEIEAIINPDYAIAPQKILKVRNEVAEKVEKVQGCPYH